MTRAVDIFAGPGGWDLAATYLGLEVVGVELDDAAVATRRAAELYTVQGDVAALPPSSFRPVAGVIASPPCPGFSQAGKGEGRQDLPGLLEHVPSVLQGGPIGDVEWADWRSPLTLEPARWVHALQPEWVALEQVPSVLPVWEAMADGLRGLGYNAWAGVLHAEEYGVPQTRERAIMVAHRTRSVGAPDPTHQRYEWHKEGQLSFLPPPVSMYEALGWDQEVPEGVVLANNTSANACVRPPHLPAGTIYFGERLNQMRWLRDGEPWDPADLVGFPRKDDLGTSPDGYRVRDRRPASEPAFGLTEKARSWTRTRPARTVGGTHGAVAGKSKRLGFVNLTVQEAAALQTFPPDYPWQGSRTRQFKQIGNAVPPLLAYAVLRPLVEAECVHCGKATGTAHDEHEACVKRAAEEAVS